MTLREVKSTLKKCLSQISEGRALTLRVKPMWNFTTFIHDDEDVVERTDMVQKLIRFTDWLITIVGKDADAKETADVIINSPIFHRYVDTVGLMLHGTLSIASNKAGYTILKAILASKAGQDSAEQGQQDGGQDQGAEGNNPGQGHENQDLQQNPSGGSQGDSDGHGEHPQGEGDSQSTDGIGDHGADRGTESDSPSGFAASPQAFWPEETECKLDAAARQAARILFSKIKKYSAGNAANAPLINSKKLIKEMVSMRYNLTKIKGRAITKPRKTLIMVDVSGSCSSTSPSTNAAAKAVYHAAPELVVIMWHVNGVYEKHLGAFPQCEIGFIEYANGERYATPKWWGHEWGLIVSFGDDDTIQEEVEACKLGATLLKLDSYGKNKQGFKQNDKHLAHVFAHAPLEPMLGRYIYCQGCDNASDLAQGLKLL